MSSHSSSPNADHQVPQTSMSQQWRGAACSRHAEANVGSSERVFSTAFGGVLVASGLLRGRLRGLLLTAAGASLLYRGLTGHCAVYQQLGINTHEAAGQRAITKGVKIEESIRIAKPASELYQMWTQWERLPEILPHIDEVKDLGQGRTRWTVRGPLGIQLRWEAEVIGQDSDRMIAWQSLHGGDIDTAGSVHFDAIDANTTEMKVAMQYEPPGGRLTAMAAEFLGLGLNQRVRRDLERFKASMESTGRASGQPNDSGAVPAAHASTDGSEVPNGAMKSNSSSLGNG